jgi:hypothetical protein
MTARLRRWLTLALAPIAATAILLTPVTPAHAAPTTPPATADEGGADETIDKVLDETGRDFAKAKSQYDKSRDAQLARAIELKAAETQRDALLPMASEVAGESYRSGGLSDLGFLLNADDSKVFLNRALALDELNSLNDSKLRAVNAAVERVAVAKTALDQEVKNGEKTLAQMNNKKANAEKALALIGGEGLTAGFVVANSPVARPAPRNADGGFSPESCSVQDPTTSGCITPRMKHLYDEVKRAGFSNFVGCHRNGGPFEHPKGRACDWSLQKSGFSVSHNATMKKYGNDLMAFLVRNADNLGILYVIWFKQIWFPATGWKTYHGPSAHTDHVHVSVL